MKDRVRQIMESMHMTQQVFAQFIEMSPASLSSIFNGRTRPTLNIVEAIKKKIPNINTDWLMFGSGSMYIQHDADAPAYSPDLFGNADEPIDSFEVPASSPTPGERHMGTDTGSGTLYDTGTRNARPEIIREEIKYIDKPQRKITEIRIYFDDLTYETFVPSKGK